MSGKGVDLIKSYEGLIQNAEVTDAGDTIIGYGHKLNKGKQEQTVVQETTATATEIVLRSTEDWPPFGTANVGNEIITWGNKTVNKLLGVKRGVSGTIPQVFKKGITCTFPGESFPEGITRQQADALFDNDIIPCIDAVRKLNIKLNPNQADACISLAQSLGPTAFSQSTVVAALNQNNFAKATTEFMRYNRAPTNVVTFSNGALVKTLTMQVNPGQTRRRVEEAKCFSSPATSVLRNIVNTALGS